MWDGARCAMFHIHRRRGTILLALLVAVLFAGLVRGIVPPQAHAASFDLTGSCPGGVGDVAALIAAINTANSNGEADVITLAAGCVYTLTSVDNTTDGDNGLPVISSEITLTGNGATIQRDSVTPAPDFRIFYVGSSGNLTLNDLTVQNGVADYGAGIYNDGGRVTLSGVAVRDNFATWFGGGIENLGTLDAQGCTIAGNSTDDSSAGIYNEGPMILTQCTVSGNIAARDGGGITNYGDVTISNSTISNNQAQSADPFEGRGGGISHLRGDMQIINSTLSGNSGQAAGAIYYFGEDDIAMTLTHVTIFSNSSGINLEAMPEQEIRYQGSIIAGNAAFDCATEEGTFTSLGYNLLGSAGGCPGGGTGDQTTADPLLDVLADNGGSTWTHALLPGSPALDQIPAVSCVLATDQRGLSRPYPAGGSCDIGAYEEQPAYALTVTPAGAGAGTVTSAPPGINCGVTCSALFTSGTVVTLTATPDAGSSFGGWSANCTVVGADCVVTMTADITVTATFDIAAPEMYFVYLPLVVKPAYPDLVVQDVTATSNSITVVVQNIGQAPVVTPFWVDAYIDPHPAPAQVNDIWYDGRSTQGIVWGVTDELLPMQPGAVITLTYGDAYDGGPPYTFFAGGLPAGTPVWAQVDSYNAATNYGAVLESHEANDEAYNNIFAPVYSTGIPSEPGPVRSLVPALESPRAGWDHLPLRPGR
jgi:hypothetical protein